MTSILDLVIQWEAQHAKADAIIYHPDSNFPVEAVYYSPYKEPKSIKTPIQVATQPGALTPVAVEPQNPMPELSDEELNKILGKV